MEVYFWRAIENCFNLNNFFKQLFIKFTEENQWAWLKLTIEMIIKIKAMKERAKGKNQRRISEFISASFGFWGL